MPTLTKVLTFADLARIEPRLALLLAEAKRVSSVGYPTNTTRRVLEDLACYGIISRTSGGEGRADTWTLTDWTKTTFDAATITTLPEIGRGGI